MNNQPHTVFEYMYRDAANYKTSGQCLLEGQCDDALNESIRTCCEVWNQFVAEQVGVPVLYADLYKENGGPTADDMAFHEFEMLRPATLKDLASQQVWGSLDDLVARFRAVKYWDCTLSPHC